MAVAAHWIYGIVTLLVIITMICRRGIVLPTLIGTFLVASVYKLSIVEGFKALFNANLVAAKELFSIFLIITLMMALLHALKDLGADERMIAPLQKIMKNGHLAFLILIVTTYVLSLFFWPTPAVPLICALLLPAAVRAGLPSMAVAMTVAIVGQGMALSSDYIMQVAPMLTAKAAGIKTAGVADKALILSLITGGIALGLSYLSIRKTIRKPNSEISEKELALINPVNTHSGTDEIAATAESTAVKKKSREKWGKFFAVIVPLSLLAVMVFMFSTKFGPSNMGGFEGGDGAAFIGGVATLLLILACLAYWRMDALDKIGDHLTEGFVFAFRAMGPVIPIAGFFFLGSSDFSGAILSISGQANPPAFLFDIIQAGQSYIPDNGFLAGFVILAVGIITGLDGSGFSGLPLVGALSGAMTHNTGIDSDTLSAIGQMGSVWTGGGTLIAWSSLVAIAGFCRVSVLELARRNFIPVMAGLIVSTIVAVIIW